MKVKGRRGIEKRGKKGKKESKKVKSEKGDPDNRQVGGV
jgi:hypothetical protein